MTNADPRSTRHAGARRLRALALCGLVLAAAGCNCAGKALKRAGPTISVSPASVGPLAGTPGRFVETTLQVRNIGTGALVLAPAPKFVEKDGDGVVEFGVSSLLEVDCGGTARPAANRNTLEAGQCARLVFRYLPNGDGKDPADLHIYSNDADTPDLVVPINAAALTPKLQVCAYDGTTKIDCAVPGSTYEVAFGTAAPGAKVARTLRLTSVGSTTVNIHDLSLSGDADFTVLPATLHATLTAGQSTDLAATFDALAGGGREADLVISSDDATDPKLTVRLIATGDASKLCLCVGAEGERCDPAPVADFGQVPIAGVGHKYLRLASCGTKPLTLEVAALTDGAPAFGASPPTLGAGVVLQPGEQLTPDIPLTFQPPTADTFTGRFTLKTDSEQGYVTLQGQGVVSGCQLEAPSNVLDFGQVAVGYTGKKDYTVANRGTTDCIIPAAPSITAGADVKFGLAGIPVPGTTVPPGQTVKFTVSYTPQDDVGPDVGELTIGYGDAAGGVATAQLTVQLKGTPTLQPECVLTALPGAASAFGRTLNFGQVRIHSEKILPITFENTGSAPCTLGHATLTGGILPGQPAPFTLKSQPQSPLAPGDTTTVNVAFDPVAEGQAGSPLPGFPGGGMFGASVKVQTSDTASFDGQDCASFGGSGNPGCVSWGLSGEGVTSSLIVLPSDLDFGVVTLGCNSRDRIVTLYNVGSTPVHVNAFKIDPAPPPEIFKVVSPASPTSSHPITINGGQELPVTVRFHPAATGLVSGELYIDSDAAGTTGGSNPYTTVRLTGTGTTDASQTDTFTQADHPIADVLWVIDMDSDSMADKQQAIATNAQAFIAGATTAGTDYHLGVVSSYLGGDEKTNTGGGCSPFGGTCGGTTGSSFNNVTIHPGVLYHDNGARAWVEKTDPNPVQEFANNAKIGVSNDATGYETGLEAMYEALSDPLINDPSSNKGFLRPDARLVVISISDDDDLSIKNTSFYAAFLQSLKPGAPDQVVFDNVGGDLPNGCTNGVDGDAPQRYADVVNKTGGKLYSICNGDYSSIAADLSLGSFGGRTRWVLSRPCDPSSLKVTVNGSAVASPGGYTYDATANAINLAQAPPPGATITATYDTLCL